MTQPLVLITHPLPTDWISSLEGRVRLLVNPMASQGITPQNKAQMSEVEGILCLLTDIVDQELLNLAPRLKVVSNMAVGFDNIDVAACSQRGIPVGNTPGVLTDATADLTIALLLAQARILPKASKDARDGLWQTWSPTGWLGRDLRGATLGIVGMGKIGKAVAERIKGFGVKIIYTDTKKIPEIESSYNAKFLSLDELLKESDFVSVHCPLTTQTRGLLNKRAFRSMKSDAILINTARGPIIDTNSLVEALKNGWIGGSALDVTDPEPLPPNHPLYSLTNCLVVPHIGSATYGTRRRMAELACENLLAGINGEKLPNLVNSEIYTSKI